MHSSENKLHPPSIAVKAKDSSEKDCRWILLFSEVSGHNTEGSWCEKPPAGKAGKSGGPTPFVGNGGRAGGTDTLARLLPTEPLFIELLELLPVGLLPVEAFLFG